MTLHLLNKKYTDFVFFSFYVIIITSYVVVLFFVKTRAGVFRKKYRFSFLIFILYEIFVSASAGTSM